MSEVIFPVVFDQLAEAQVSRRMYIRNTNRLTNACRAYVRRAMGFSVDLPEGERKKIRLRAEKFVKHVMADGTAPADEDERLFDALAPDIELYRQSIEPFRVARMQIEKQMRRMARSLPAWASFAADVSGLGDLGFAVIVGECGDLANYSNPAKVWKRLGLAPYNGKAASTWRGSKPGLSAEEWSELGYSPARRAEIYACVGDSLFRAQTVAGKRPDAAAPYRTIYDARRARTAETHSEWTKKHSHEDALRIMTKAMIRDLWCAWNGRAVRTEANKIAA